MSNAYGFFMVMSKMPAYLASVFALDITNNGAMNGAAMLVFGAISFSVPYLSQWLINRARCRKIHIRKLFQTFSNCGPALCLFLIPTVAYDCEPAAIALLISA